MKKLFFSAILFFVAALTGCNNEPPSLLPIGNKEVRVGETLEIIVAAMHPKNRSLTFSSDNMPIGATFTQFAPTQARFTWSPTAADTGDTFVNFHVSSGKLSDSERVIITVKGETSEETGPVFIGQTTWTLETGQKNIEKIIEIRDPGSSSFDWRISNEPDGSTFTPLFRQAVFFWEPAPQQLNVPQYTFTVTVTNDRGIQASQVFTILVRAGGGENVCPESRTMVESITPQGMTGANNFEVSAIVHDSVGTINSVNLRWSDKDDPAISDYVQASMTSSDNDVYTGDVQLSQDLEPGTYATISFYVCAQSDYGNNCIIETCTRRHSFTAQRPGGKGLCEPCTTSSECGTENDHCIPGSMPGEMFCATDCSENGFCPTGYQCTDLGGGTRQCVPLGNSCQPSDFRAARPGELVINEVLPAPPRNMDVNGDGIASTRGDEFVEIVSTANVPVDIGGFTISDRIQVRYTFPMGTVIPPGEAVVVFGGGDPSNFNADFGGAQVFSVLPDPEGHGLVLRDAGDEVIVRDNDFVLITAMSYGDLSSVSPDNRYSLSLEPPVTGLIYVPTTLIPSGSGAAYSPGRQYCGRPFPISVHGTCQGRVCGDRAPNEDDEPNNDRFDASCIHTRTTEIMGQLNYHGTDSNSYPGPDPADYYVFHAKEGDVLDLVTLPCDLFEPVQDTYLELLDATGTIIAENDDSDEVSPMLYAEILNHRIPATGRYYAVVRTFHGTRNDSGCYILWHMLAP